MCLLWVLCFVRKRSLRYGDHFSRVVLSSVMRLSVIKEPDRGGKGPLGLSCSNLKNVQLEKWSQDVTSGSDFCNIDRGAVYLV
jgi:hypothetical protein